MKNKSTKVKDLIAEWQEVHCKNLAASTQYGYMRYIQAHILPELGEFKLCNIMQKDIQLFINHLAGEGKSEKTQKNMLGILHLMFEYAILNKMINCNPAKKIQIRKTARYTYNIYTQKEFTKLVESFKNDKDIILILLGGVCGMRLSEVFGLKWSDIDFKECSIKIQRAAVDVNGKTDLKPTTKTAAGWRTIAVPPKILKIIKKYQDHAEFIFPSKTNPNIPANSHNFYQRYSRKIKKAGLPHTRFHDLRHFAATQFLDAGVPDKYVAAYLGHADTNMTKKYQHIRKQVIPFPMSDNTPKTNKKFDNEYVLV